MVLYLLAMLLAIGGTAAAIFVVLRISRQKLAATSGAACEALVGQINTSDTELSTLLARSGGYAGKGEHDALAAMVESAKVDLARENESLRDLEGKLDTAQKLVEEKEAAQQEMKTIKEEDETKLQELLAAYSDISNEAIELEQRLAQTLKNLDSILNEVDLTQNQKAVLTELSEAMTNGGARLRDLLTEYQTVNDRLAMLRQQFEDLEEEYTRLVEQQLGD